LVEKSVEPREAITASNLFAKAKVRLALADETKPRGSEVPRIVELCSFVGNGGNAERLARA
jgi:hypothetical protein